MAGVNHHSPPSALTIAIPLLYAALLGHSAFGRSNETTTHTLTQTASCWPPLPFLEECPAPVIENITDTATNRSHACNCTVDEPRNCSVSVDWNTSYVAARDSYDSCNYDTDPSNFFTRRCVFYLDCNHPNVTNGSVIFSNLTVTVDSVANALTEIFLEKLVIRNINITITNETPTNVMFNMVNQSLGIGTYVFPNAQQSFPMSPSGQTNPPFIVLTNRWDEVAEVEMQFGSFENLPWMTYANISVRGGFGCMVAIDYVYFEGNPSAADLFLIFGVPLLLVALLVGLGLLKWAFPDLCVCKKRADEMGVEDDEKSLEAARQREARRLKGLGEPLVLHEKMGMTTWLDEAEDVVVDLNTNC